MQNENTAADSTPRENGEADKTSEQHQPDQAASDPVRRWTLIILVLCLVLVGWYLRSDRVTPMTSQARVYALVVPVAPEVSGTVTSVSVANNQTVSAGQVLFQIDIERFELAVQAARATLDQARQSQGAAQASVDSARASLAAAKASEERSRLDAVRIRAIREQDPGAISQRRVESAEASLASAQSRVESARAGLDAALQQLGKPGDENASIQQALASLDTAQLNLQRATVRAPEDGVVTGVQLDTGNFASAGAPQLTFISTKNIWLQADFTENNLGHLRPGNEVGIVFDGLPGQVVKGSVREIGYGVAVNNPPLGSLPTINNDNNWLRASQRYPVLIDFDRPQPGEQIPLKVGSQATVAVYTGENPLFNLLASWYLRALSILTYAY